MKSIFKNKLGKKGPGNWKKKKKHLNYIHHTSCRITKGLKAGHQEMGFHNKSQVKACYTYMKTKMEIGQETSWLK